MQHPKEETFRRWGKPPGATESERCANAVSVVRNAMAQHKPFESRIVEVFAQGSYRNGTNVRAESDVDVCVRCMDVFFTNLPDGMKNEHVGVVDSRYTYAEFKDEVERALRDYLGHTAVKRGDKAIDLHENTYRVDADVVATFEHRRYSANGTYLSGTEFRSDSGKRIVNWPHQNYENGNVKNDATRTRFKKIVRVLKNLRNEMLDAGIDAAKPIPSYLIECLVWNAPTWTLDADEAYATNLRKVVGKLFVDTEGEATCSEWGEINELKYLFRSTQPWTRTDVNAFLLAAWGHAKLASDA